MLFSFLFLISSQRYRKIRPFQNINNNFDVVSFHEKFKSLSPECFNPILEYSLSYDPKKLDDVKASFLTGFEKIKKFTLLKINISRTINEFSN